MRAFATIYKCSNCDSLIQGIDYWSGNTFGGISYSDTYVKAGMKMPDTASYIGCANCNNAFVKKDLQIIKQYKEEEFNKEEYEKALKPLSSFNTLKIILEDSKFKKEENRKAFTLWYLHGFNHEIKLEQKQEEINNGNYKKYTDELIKILDSEIDNVNSQVLKAEILRERGEFNEADKMLNYIDKSKFTTRRIQYVFEEMKKRIVRKDSAVFEADEKPDFIK